MLIISPDVELGLKTRATRKCLWRHEKQTAMTDDIGAPDNLRQFLSPVSGNAIFCAIYRKEDYTALLGAYRWAAILGVMDRAPDIRCAGLRRSFGANGLQIIDTVFQSSFLHGEIGSVTGHEFCRESAGTGR